MRKTRQRSSQLKLHDTTPTRGAERCTHNISQRDTLLIWSDKGALNEEFVLAFGTWWRILLHWLQEDYILKKRKLAQGGSGVVGAMMSARGCP